MASQEARKVNLLDMQLSEVSKQRSSVEIMRGVEQSQYSVLS